MKRYRVTLSIPAEDEESTPQFWDWQDLLNTQRPVDVQNVEVVPLLDYEEEDYGA